MSKYPITTYGLTNGETGHRLRKEIEQEPEAGRSYGAKTINDHYFTTVPDLLEWLAYELEATSEEMEDLSERLRRHRQGGGPV